MLVLFHSELVLPGFFEDFVPANRYAAIINAQVRFLDRMNRVDDSRCQIFGSWRDDYSSRNVPTQDASRIWFCKTG